jgi:hypothetical protein
MCQRSNEAEDECRHQQTKDGRDDEGQRQRQSVRAQYLQVLDDTDPGGNEQQG